MPRQLISDATLSMIIRFKESDFYDKCRRMVHVEQNGGLDHPVFTSGTAFGCRFLPISGSPRPAPDALDEAHVPMGDADIYYSHNDFLGPHDRVVITHQHGELLVDPKSYDIVAGPIRESTGFRATLKLVVE